MTMGDPIEAQILEVLPVLIDKLSARINATKTSAGEKRDCHRALVHAQDLLTTIPAVVRHTEAAMAVKPKRNPFGIPSKP